MTHSHRLIRGLALGLLSAGLAACAARNPWVNSSVPKSQWDRDWSRCKDRADAAAGLDTPSYSPDSRLPNPFAQYDQDSKKSEVDDAVESCMIGLGYVPARKRP